MIRILCSVLVSLLAGPVLAQSILLDHVTACARLVCYPSATDEHRYYYLPSEPRLVVRADGTPEFSFLRYVKAAESTNDYSGITTADGGGIVHFLVSYETTSAERSDALDALRELDEDAELAGPVSFKEGYFALVSSITNLPQSERERLAGEQSEYAYAVAGVGRAPLLEGLKSAVSIHLTKLGADILLASFQTATPDISLVFDLTYSGLRDPAEVTITGDWTKLQEHIEASVGVGVGYGPIDIGFDYDDMWDKARTNGIISVNSVGDVQDLQPYIDRAYDQLQKLMFDPVPVEVYEESGPDLANMMQQMMYAAGNDNQNPQAMAQGKPFYVTLKGGFKRRQIEREGSFELDFRRQMRDDITTAMAGNIGDLHQRYGANEDVFRTVNIGRDPVYRFRPVAVVVDIRDSEDFRNYVNSVSFRLMKKHGSGSTTVEEVLITRNTFQEGANLMVGYPWDGETSDAEWLSYDYEVAWSFIGGARHRESGTTSDSAFTLSAPYQYREVRFIADRDTLAANDVKLVTVRVSHDFYGRPRSETITLGRGMDSFSETREFAVPPGDDSLTYNITWRMEDDSKKQSGDRTSDEQIIWVDEMPSE